MANTVSVSLSRQNFRSYGDKIDSTKHKYDTHKHMCYTIETRNKQKIVLRIKIWKHNQQMRISEACLSYSTKCEVSCLLTITTAAGESL